MIECFPNKIKMKYQQSQFARKNMKIGAELNNAIRIGVLIIAVSLLFVIIILRLIQLQIVESKKYSEMAKNQHFGAIELPARRGEILVRDTHSGELSKLATNTTLDLLYIDPFVADDKITIAKELAPLLFDQADYKICLEKPDDCQYNVIDEDSLGRFMTTQPVWDLGITDEIQTKVDKPQFKSYTAMADEVAANILRKISKLEVDFFILKRDVDTDLMAEVINERLPGVFVDPKRFMIYADPTLIPETRLTEVATRLSKFLGETPTELEGQLSRRKVRYVFLKNKLDPEVSRHIRELDLRGVVLLPEHWRFYPENSLAANVVGFLNRDNIGQYGVEGYFNVELEGKKGTIYAESDPFGRQITVGESKIVNAVDGDTIVLTIDRIVQKKVEDVLKEAVERFRADNGQVIIMDPFTGAVIAMANYPSFDPNHFGDVFALRPLEKDEELYSTVPVFKRNEKGVYLPIEESDPEKEEIEKFVYVNKFGSGALKNKIISDYYEPGSTFKPIVMSIALDAKEVEPQTTFIDDGPLKIDEFEIKNSDNQYHGKATMTEVLEKSLNTGMSFVAKKIGKKLTYEYLKNFGLGEYTNVQLEGETKGGLDYYKRWSKAQLLTISFGQGIVVTPLQMITAWAALANGGKLMEPYIVDTIIRGNETIKNEPSVIQRVISEETSSIITSMLISVVRRGHAKPADIPGYLIAGKTGTAQVAGKGGKYETGDGSTITSFAGYLPALEPRFVMLIKFERPRIGENTWGATTAAPTFRAISEFLIDYYNLQSNS